MNNMTEIPKELRDKPNQYWVNRIKIAIAFEHSDETILRYLSYIK